MGVAPYRRAMRGSPPPLRAAFRSEAVTGAPRMVEYSTGVPLEAGATVFTMSRFGGGLAALTRFGSAEGAATPAPTKSGSSLSPGSSIAGPAPPVSAWTSVSTVASSRAIRSSEDGAATIGAPAAAPSLAPSAGAVGADLAGSMIGFPEPAAGAGSATAAGAAGAVAGRVTPARPA